MRKIILSVKLRKNGRKPFHSGEEGYALIAALLGLVLVTIFGLSSMDTALLEKEMSGGSKRYQQELKLAESAIFEAAQRIENDDDDTNHFLYVQDVMPEDYRWVHEDDENIDGTPKYIATPLNDLISDYSSPGNPIPPDDYLMSPENWHWDKDLDPNKVNCASLTYQPPYFPSDGPVAQFLVVKTGRAAGTDVGESGTTMVQFSIYGRFYEKGVGWRVVKVGYRKRIKT